MEFTIKLNKDKVLWVLVIAALILSGINLYRNFSLSNKIQAFIVSGNEGDNNNGSVSQKDSQDKGNSLENKKISADDDPFLGPEDAKVVVIEFSDFQCPYCAAAVGTQKTLVQRFKSIDSSWEPAVLKLKEWAREGKIKFVYRDFPLSQIHQYSQKAAEAAECAHQQGKFWEYHDTLFAHQDKLDVDNLKKYAKELGLNVSEFNKCLDSNEMRDEVMNDLKDGINYGVNGTPTFFVNGKIVEGAQSFSVFEEFINQELSK